MSFSILIVDDNPNVRAAMRGILATLASPDLQLREATNGGEAVLSVESSTPDLVLLDLTMPVMGGVETARAGNQKRFIALNKLLENTLRKQGRAVSTLHRHRSEPHSETL